MTKMGKLMVLGMALCVGLGTSVARAIPITGIGSPTAMESFEGLTPGPNLTLAFGGYLEPGVLSPFTFASGLTFSAPVPNPGIGTGVIIGDFSIGSPATFGLLGNGAVSSAADVPDGSAYMGLDDPAFAGPIEFTLPGPVSAIGALVTGTPGTITITVYDSAHAFIESHSIASVAVGLWPTNFLGIATPGIHFVEYSGDFEVLDKVQWAARVPEPSTLMLLGIGLAGLGWMGRKKQTNH